MTTKNFSVMTTKKLTALLETANSEDKKAIQAVLDARKQAAEQEVSTGTAASANNDMTDSGDLSELNDAQKAVLDAAEASEATGNKETSKAPEAQNEDLFESLMANKYHKCQVVPFNTLEWKNGYIASVLKDPKSGRIMYAIKLEDGRRIVKVHNSPLLKVSEEMIELAEKSTHAGRPRIKKEKLTDEEVAQIIADATPNVGKIINIARTKVTETGVVDGVTKGRIVAVRVDHRTNCVMYSVKCEDGKALYRSIALAANEIEPEFDEEGLKMQAAYAERNELAKNRQPLTVGERIMKCEENLKRAEERVKKANEFYEKCVQELAAAKAALPEAEAEEPEDLN